MRVSKCVEETEGVFAYDSVCVCVSISFPLSLLLLLSLSFSLSPTWYCNSMSSLLSSPVIFVLNSFLKGLEEEVEIEAEIERR